MTKLKDIILYTMLLITLFNFGFTYSQQSEKVTINGFIYDSKTGEALIGANAHIEGSNLGATSNLSGFFAIPGVTIGKHTLIVSFMGYKNQAVNLNVKKSSSDVIKVMLKENVVETQEIVIKGDSVRTIDKLFIKPVSRVELNATQINNIPRVIEADLLRSLQTIPGIQPLSDFSSSLYVRGGTPDQNLYLIDGTDVYNPEHAFGLFSTFNTSAIKKVELSKGGFSAEYGGRLSSILNVTNLDGNRYNFKGEANISLIAASATLQAPLGSIGSISGSLRRTYIDVTYAKVVKEIPDYYFYDGNVKAYFDLDEKDKLTVSFYGGQDKLNFVFDKDKPNSLGFNYDWGNTTGSINWKRIFNPGMFANFWITASRFSSNFDFNDVGFSEKNEISDISVKGNLEYYITKDFNLKFGFENKILHGSLKEEFPGGLVDADEHRNQYSAYITSNYKPVESLDIETGLRYDFFRTAKNYQNLDPRFTLRYRLSELSNLKFSAGVFHQYLNRMPRLFLASIWSTSDQYTKGSSANHFILGYQREIDQIYELEVEAYYKQYFNVYSYNQTFLTDISPDSYNSKGEPIYTQSKSLYNRGDSKSYGIEFLLRKDYGAVTGWVGYSYSITKTMTDGINQNKYYNPRHDRTHTVNVITNVNINDFFAELKGESGSAGNSKWLLGLNFIYASGQPITLPNSVYYNNQLPDWNDNKNNLNLFPADINSAKLPAYIRMDISLTWEKNYGSWVLAPYLQIFNVGNRKNTWFVTYDNKIENGVAKQEVKNTNMMPILPSIGVNIKF